MDFSFWFDKIISDGPLYISWGLILSEDHLYAHNFEKVEGAYCFGLFSLSSICPLQKLSYSFEIS